MADLGNRPKGWFSRRHETSTEHVEASEVYGNRRDRKAQRQIVAGHNAAKVEHDRTRAHREDRCDGSCRGEVTSNGEKRERKPRAKKAAA